jgi:hypothetical protein
MTSLPAHGERHDAPRPLTDDELLLALDDSTHPDHRLAWERFSQTCGEKLLRLARARFPQDQMHHADWVEDAISTVAMKFPSSIDGGWLGLQKYTTTVFLHAVFSRKRQEARLRPLRQEYVASRADASHADIDVESTLEDGRPDRLEQFRSWLERVALPKLRPVQRAILLAMFTDVTNEALCAQLSVTPRALAKARANLMKRLRHFGQKHPLDD